MMTIEEVKNISFRRAGRNGYMAEDVDNFIDEVLVSLKQYESEKNDIMKKIEILAKRLEKYRADEEIIKNALIRSERIAESALSEAKVKADAIVSEAQAKADKMIAEANIAATSKRDDLIGLETGAAEFRAKLLKMYDEQIKLVSKLPDEKAADEVKKKYSDIEVQNIKIDSDDAQEIAAEPEKQELNDTTAETKKDEEIRRIPLTTPIQNVDTEEEDLRKTRSFPISSLQETDSNSKTEKRRHRFPVLKFGDNYDVDDE